MNTIESLWLLISITESVSLFLLTRIWKSSDSRIFKILRTALTLVPILGPVFYALTSNPPSRLPPNLMDKLNCTNHTDLGYTPNYSRQWEREKPELERKIQELQERS